MSSTDFLVTNALIWLIKNVFCLYNLRLILLITTINTNTPITISNATYVTSGTLTYSILSSICDCNNKSS